jgi:glycosyltransferase involved in cell wall biosynthesis
MNIHNSETRQSVLHVGVSQTLDSVCRDQLHGLRALGWDLQLACAADGWHVRLLNDGFIHHNIAMSSRPGMVQVAQGVKDMARILRQGHFVLVHTHNAHHGIIARSLARGLGIPSVHTWRYSPLDASQRQSTRLAYRSLETIAGRMSSAVLFQNQADMDSAVGLGIVPPKRAVLIRNGIVIERYTHSERPRAAVRRDLGVPENAPLIICVARLEERKRQIDLIRAVVSMRRRNCDAYMALVGTGRDEVELRSVVERYAMSSKVLFLGQRADIPDLIHASDVFCLPSRREGIPRSVMEAMAARVPVVATDVVGTREVVRAGRTGLLVPFGDAEALGRALEHVLDAPAAAAARAEVAHKMLLDRWSEKLVIQRIHAVYQSILEQSCAATFDSLHGEPYDVQRTG